MKFFCKLVCASHFLVMGLYKFVRVFFSNFREKGLFLGMHTLIVIRNGVRDAGKLNSVQTHQTKVLVLAVFCQCRCINFLLNISKSNSSCNLFSDKITYCLKTIGHCDSKYSYFKLTRSRVAGEEGNICHFTLSLLIKELIVVVLFATI